MSLVAVILAGGTGTRFWPASTSKKPKQFLTLVGNRSLLQMSYDRIAPLVTPERTLVITSQKFAPTVKKQLPMLPKDNVIAEPMRRDTAAAVALAALLVEKRFGPSTVVVLTADHLINPAERFREAVLAAAERAGTGKNVYTFGIPPTSAATGYGYLEVGDQVLSSHGVSHHAVLQFHEKPDAETARSYVESKRYFWNSGMFVWHTSMMRRALEQHLPGHVKALEAVVEKRTTLKKAFMTLPTISIDKGVMEKLATTMCVKANFEWSDVGSFPALAPHLSMDDKKNASRGRLRVRDSGKNVVWCEDSKEIVALVGVTDLIVVRAGKRTLVAPRDRAEEIKKLVESLPAEEQ